MALSAPVRAETSRAERDLRATFAAMASQFIADRLRESPTWATGVGEHRYDAILDDYSLAGRRKELAAMQEARAAFAAFDPNGLDRVSRGDRALIVGYIDSDALAERTSSPLTRDPDRYSSGITASAFSLVNREYAPARVRLAALNARLEAMPAVLELARTQLGRPPKINTLIALEQIDGHVEVFADTLPAAFKTLRDPAGKARLKRNCARVIAALRRYETFLKRVVLPRSDGQFALGAEAYRAKLRADDQIDLPLEKLLEIGRADLARNQREIKALAAKIAPGKGVMAALTATSTATIQEKGLLTTIQGTVLGIRDFASQRHLVTVPAGAMPKVTETPSYMRATTLAAMDTPGPFEKKGMASYYYVTLPDPGWTKAEKADFLSQMSAAGIANTTVHEAIPGHYMQFLAGPKLPSVVRHVLASSATVEGWAHYCEQLMSDEGYQKQDPRYRLAMIQDALVRDVRLLVGIQLHTGAMTLDEAVAAFQRDAYLPKPVARSEAWRAPGDPTYGYYTLGKLAIQKLRADVQRKQGASFSLQAFHDALLAEGGAPLGEIREDMLGERGDLL